MSGILADRVGLVVGASSEDSLGFQAASGFAHQGAQVILSCRKQRKPTLSQKATQIGVDLIELDVLQPDSMQQAFSYVLERYGRLDFLVHTIVGVESGLLRESILDLSAEDFCRTMQVSVHSLVKLAQLAQPLLLQSRAPRIVSLLSSGGDFTIPNYHLVGICKAALHSTICYIAQELGPLGVLCNGVCFSIVPTDAALRVIGKSLTTRSHDHITKHSLTQIPLQYSHVTSAMAFLASAHCQNMTAEVLTVDGGYSRNYF